MNKNMSSDSRNQFISDSSVSRQYKQQDLQNIMRYMKTQINNQQLMQNLQRHLKQKQQGGSRIINQSVYYQQNLIQSRKQHPKQIQTDRSRGGDMRVSQLNQQYHQSNTSVSIVKSKDNRKKGTDVLSKYISNNTNQNQQEEALNQKKAQVLIKNSKSNVNNNFDQRPINSKYHENLLAYGSIDKNMDYTMPAQYPDTNQKGINKKDLKVVQKKPVNKQPVISMNNRYNSYEDIPISQLKSQFQNSLQNQQPFLIQKQQHNAQGSQQDQDKKPAKQFLKRGSRQYLSSAKDRPSITKKTTSNKQQQMNNSYFNQDRDRTPKRDTSQNRVLVKRNNNSNAEKSQTKIGKNNANLNTSTNKSTLNQKQQTEPPRRSITPRKAKPPIHKPVIQTKQEIPKVKTFQQNAKKVKNIFQDEDSQGQYQNNNFHEQTRKNNFIPSSYSTKQSSNQKQFDLFSRQKKIEVIEGVYLTQTQLNEIVKRYAAPLVPSTDYKTKESKQIIELRKKYTDLCQVVEQQKQQLETQIQKKRQEFQIFKANQLTKMKNQKRVMQRQLKSTMPSHSQLAQKDREEVQALKKQLQKEKDQHKKKQKNNRILIQKYKKESQDLKLQMDSMQRHIAQMKKNQQSLAASTRVNVNNNSNSMLSNSNKSNIVQNNRSMSPSISSKKSITKKNQHFQQDCKQTVPLNQKKKISQTSQSSKSQYNNDSKFNTDTNQIEDDYLPTFKVARNQQKVQKKYEYVQKNQNAPHLKGKNNAFAKSSQSESQHSDSVSNESEGQSLKKTNLPKKNLQLSDINKGNISIKMITSSEIQKLFKYQNNPQYKKYLQAISNPRRQVINSSKNAADKKITHLYNDQGKQVLFENGVKKQFFANGYTIIYFKNGDIKQKLFDGTILYYFKEKQVDQITLPSGLNIYRFDNNQVEFHFNNGHIEIRHPDGTIKVIQTQK